MRIGINVPNDLIKQVKAIDPDVNVSHICREALKSYVTNAGRVAERVVGDGMEDHALRLAQAYEYPIVAPDWVGYALDDARDWVSMVEPKEWERFFSIYDHCKARGDELTYLYGHIEPTRDGRCFFSRMQENMEWYEWEYDNGNEDAWGDARDEYGRTWLGYVEQVRQKQLQHIRDERDRLLAEREEVLRPRPEPEVPPQLLN